MLSTFEMTDIDGPDRLSRMIVSLHPVLFLDVLRHRIVCDVAHKLAHESQPCAPCARHKSHVIPVESAWCNA